jgi:hypothetical protein
MNVSEALDLITEAIGCDGNSSLDEALSVIRKELVDVQKPVAQQMHGKIKQKCEIPYGKSCVHKRGEFCIADMVWLAHCEFRVV